MPVSDIISAAMSFASYSIYTRRNIISPPELIVFQYSKNSLVNHVINECQAIENVTRMNSIRSNLLQLWKITKLSV